MSILFIMIGGSSLEAISELIRHIRDYAMVMRERRRFRAKIRRMYRR